MVDHLQDLILALRRPKLKVLRLPYNGIEQEFCEYFSHILNFETLEQLDLSCNWFGLRGLQRFANHFKKFVQLKKLGLSNNKLCIEEGHDTRLFADVLVSVSNTVEELTIAENSIQDADMVDFLIPALATMSKLTTIDLSRNPLTKFGIVGLVYETMQAGLTLKDLNLTGTLL